MGRLRRPHLPGVPFHITARAQLREPVFAGIEAAAVARIHEHVQFSDVLLLSYAVMPNHFHLLVVQGARPLASLMHPLMRRLALLVMRTRNREGHVFERRFRDKACLDPQYLRNSIAYVHLNGCRAGLCSTADDFMWCSHATLCASATSSLEDGRLQLGMETSMRLFARRPYQSLNACRDDYREFLHWRLDADRVRACDESAEELPAPETAGGDAFWVERFGSCVPSRAEARVVRSTGNLRDLARASIRETCPDLQLEDLRSGNHYRSIVRVRNHLIPRALLAGHSLRTVAAFLNISLTTVSRVGRR